MTLLFKRKKETKNKIVFEEVVEDDAWPAIGSLYVSKPIVAQLGLGDTVLVELRPE